MSGTFRKATNVADVTPASLVARLRDLYLGPKSLPDVVALGNAAVPPLEVLLRGPSESIPHRRCLAADALGAIGGILATAALARSLRDAVGRTPPPILLEAERVVISRIAELLADCPEPEAIDALLEAVRLRPCEACVRALGARRDTRAIGPLVACLREDAVRTGAIDALSGFGTLALPWLLRLLRDRPTGLEPPRHIDARAAAAALLGGVPGDVTEHLLLEALSDPQIRVRTSAAGALIDIDSIEASRGIDVLIRALGEADWVLAARIESILVRHASLSERAIVKAMAREAREPIERARRLRLISVAGRLDTPVALQTLGTLSGAYNPNVRLAAVVALSRSAAAEPAILARFLSDRSAIVRRRAVEGLGRRDGLSVRQAVELLGDPDTRVRTLAERRLRGSVAVAAPVLRAAVRNLGAPMRGFGRRWRLCSSACALLVGAPMRRDSPASRPRRTAGEKCND